MRAARVALVEVLVPVGAAMAAGAAVAAIVAPRWRSVGLPYVLGHGKNVELAALAAAFAAAAASRWLIGSPSGRWLAGAVATIGFGVMVAFANVPAVVEAWPQLVLMATVVTSLAVLWPESGEADVTPAADPLPRWCAVAAVGALAVVAFVATLEALEIDVFHHGEVLASAMDMLRGGRPFKTFIWPHGFHDTGLTALWILVTGKVGTSPVALGRATCRALGVLAAYGLGRQLLGSRAQALAVSTVLALAPWLLRDQPALSGGTDALYRLGILCFVVLGFGTLTSRRVLREVLAGACFGLAYLFRVEAGIFGAAGAVAVLAHRDILGARTTPLGAAGAFLGSVGQFLLGLVLALGGCRWLLGWPGSEWFAYTLRDLPRYHRDAVGLPLPWLLRGASLPPASTALAQVSIAWFLFVLLLLVQAVRAVIRRRDAERTSQLVFLAVFAALATKSSLDRSEQAHLLQWSALPLLGTLMLAVALLRDRLAWRASGAILALAVLLGLVDFWTLRVTVPRFRSMHEIPESVASQGRLLAEHLAPNPPVGACADTSFTPTEARLGENGRFIEDTCGVEGVLRSHHVSDLVIIHSAPWYYIRFGMLPPTRYFALARAYAPAAQRELVADLRARLPEAALAVQGYGALPEFDVPDAVRLPVVDAYLRERRRGAAGVVTPLGLLSLWNEAAICPRSEAEAPSRAATGVQLAVDLALYQPMSGLLFARGWAADTADLQPLRALELADRDLAARLEFGQVRRDVASRFHADALARSGWELVGHVSPAGLDTLRAGTALRLDAVLADGSKTRLALDLRTVRVLGSLSGPEWADLAPAVEQAAELGRGDRAAACRQPGNGRTCDCSGAHQSEGG